MPLSIKYTDNALKVNGVHSMAHGFPFPQLIFIPLMVFDKEIRSGMQGNFQTLPKEERFQRNRRLNRQLNQHHWAPRTARKMSTSKVSALVLNHLHDLIITNI